MKDKPGPDLASQMKQARDLLEKGEVRDALVLALEVLWRELDELRGTLGDIEESLPSTQDEALVGVRAEPSQPEYIWPEPPSRLLH